MSYDHSPSREELDIALAASKAEYKKYLAEQDAKKREQELERRTPIVSAFKDIFAPQNFDEFIGQDNVKRQAQIMIEAAKKRNTQLPSMLITGEYGLGKTTFGKLITKAYLGKTLRPDDANRIGLDNYPKGGVVLIDEIHNLNGETQDSMNTPIDEGDLSVIGMTTDSGELSAPFRSRFRILHLEPYSIENLIEILTQDAIKQNIEIPAALLVQMALRSRFNARQATQNLASVAEMMAVKDEHELTEITLIEVFDLNGLDERGLRPIDRKYLEVLGERTVGLGYLEAMLGMDKRSIQVEIEPYLMRKGLIDRTARGRRRIGA